jgi:DNA-binding transcriptional LysR family regulator
LILREPGSGTRAFVERALRRAGVGPEDLTVAAQMGSTLAVIMGVRAQVGLGFVSRRALVDELAAGRLVELEIGGLELTRQFYLITRKGRTHSPAAQDFMALLLAEAGRDEEAA